jgi:PhoPQ-activated pathogenicity-related protein
MKMPKYLINASGDQFFLPDNSQFYYGDLQEEKRLRYVPNAKHNLGGSDAVESMISFYQSIVNAKPRPKYTWTKEPDGSLIVKVNDDKPTEVRLWQATNPDARDFRVDTIGNAYKSTVLQETTKGTYVGKVDKPRRATRHFSSSLRTQGR